MGEKLANIRSESARNPLRGLWPRNDIRVEFLRSLDKSRKSLTLVRIRLNLVQWNRDNVDNSIEEKYRRLVTLFSFFKLIQRQL